ncbi:hypothetical protein H6G96_27550 [Nostoc sp. FACHB-892]|uniref:hypothetical protein n=1 Tax=Nostoc sp. FACHB-892 TaxID=2692843 RepID=UPI0016856786|nr:hypothetical protein [Nostoc sp. FACHB-892]MBD2729974.1 hypothetical protein [Nostoc sp. FACHB-892]
MPSKFIPILDEVYLVDSIAARYIGEFARVQVFVSTVDGAVIRVPEFEKSRITINP